MLIPCPSCGKQISDRAPRCPFCGHGLAAPVPGEPAAGEAPPPVSPADNAATAAGPVETSPEASAPPPAPSAESAAVTAAPVPSARADDGHPAASKEPLPTPLPSLLELNQQAAAHYNAERFPEALAVVDEILKIDPREAKALNTRANAFFKMKRKDEACAAMVKALESAPGEVSMWLNKAVIENGAGHPDDACRSALDLMEIAQARSVTGRAVDRARGLISSLQRQGAVPKPRGHLGFLGLGYASMVNKQPEAALEFFEEATAAAPENVEVLRFKARALLELGRAGDALVLYDRLLARIPDDPVVHHERGAVLARQREFGSAVDAFDRALALNPNHVPSLSDKGRYEDELGHHELALTARRRAAALMPDHPALWLDLALAEDLLNRDEDALSSFEKFIERAKPDMSAEIESSKRRVEELRARVSVRRAAMTLPPSSPPPSSAALPPAVPQAEADSASDSPAPANDGKTSETDEVPQPAAATSVPATPPPPPPSPVPPASAPPAPAPPAPPRPKGNPVAKKWAAKGRDHLAAQEATEALAAFDKAIERDPNEALYWGERGDVLKALSRPDEARASWTKALALDALCVPARRGLAAAERAEGRAAPAEIELPEVTVPRNPPTLSTDECLKRSEMERSQAFFDRALDWADQAIAGEPRKYNGWAAKAEALFGLKRYAEAAAHARKVTEMNPKFVVGWSRLASAYEALQAFEPALGAWDRALELAASNVLHWSGRGLCLEKLGRLEEALACHDKALSLDPRFSLGRFYKGKVESDLGRRESAIESLEQFVSLAPPSLAAMVEEARQRLQELKA